MVKTTYCATIKALDSCFGLFEEFGSSMWIPNTPNATLKLPGPAA